MLKFMFLFLPLTLAGPGLPLLHPGGIGGIFKGPNSETILKGPDGSIITSVAEGGEVQTKLEPIVVAEPEVVLPAAAVTKEDEGSSDLVGPSGRISTHGDKAIIAGPASITFAGPAIVAETVLKGPQLLPVSTLPHPIEHSIISLPVISSTLAPTPSVVLNDQIAVDDQVSNLNPPIVSIIPNVVNSPEGNIQSIEPISTILPPVVNSSDLNIPSVVLPSTILPNVGSSPELNIHSLIPPRNIIPPDIVLPGPTSIIPPIVDPHLSSAVPPTILPTSASPPFVKISSAEGTRVTTAGLGTVTTSTNILREEGDTGLSTLQDRPQFVGLGYQPTVNIQNYPNLRPNTPPNIAIPQPPLVSLNPNIHQNENAAEVKNVALFTPAQDLSIRSNPIQQPILVRELAKSGIDVSQLRLTKVPLSDVYGLRINNELGYDGWAKYGRQ